MHAACSLLLHPHNGPQWTYSPKIPYNKLMDKLQELIRKVLERHPEIKLCIIFGSIASGKESPDSDSDIGVAAEQPLSADGYLSLVEEFSAAATREIDLIDLTTGSISKQALSTGIVVQNSSKDSGTRGSKSGGIGGFQQWRYRRRDAIQFLQYFHCVN
jgi:predicted nucleotidyltransferase